MVCNSTRSARCCKSFILSPGIDANKHSRYKSSDRYCWTLCCFGIYRIYYKYIEEWFSSFLHYFGTKYYFSNIVRPTEIPESDVYVCESIYDEAKKQIRRNVQGSGLRKFTHTQLVTPDEIFHFKNPITPIKVIFTKLLVYI